MTSTRRAWLAGALALAGFLPAAAAGADPGLTLRLNVLMTPTPRPLSGARAEIVPTDGNAAPRSAISDFEGRVEFTGLVPGRYRATVRSEGFAEARADGLMLRPDERLAVRQVSLQPGAPIAGRVVDAAGGGIEGAEVCLSSAAPRGDDGAASGFRATPLAGGSLCEASSANGAVSFPALPFGQYLVSARAKRHAPLEGESLAHGFPGKDLTWILSPAGAISGRIVDPAERGVAGAKVLLKDRLRGTSLDGTTDGSGSFRRDGLPPGTWRVEIEPKEHLSLTRDSIVVEPFETTDLGTLRARAATALEGRVVGGDGAPLAGVEIRVHESEGAKRPLRSTQSDEKGFFRVGGLPEKLEVDLLARPPKGLWAPRSFRRLMPPLEEGVFRLEAAVRLPGKVTAEEGTLPRGVWVTISPRPGHPSFEAMGGGSATAAVDPATGAFTVEGIVPGGEVEVRARVLGFGEASVVATMVAGRDADPVELKLRRSDLLVRGQVRDRDGRPVPGARMGVAMSDAQGRFSLEGLAPGPNKIVVTHPQFAPLPYTFQVPSEEEAVVVLEDGGAIEGTVTGPRGRPLTGVHVSADLPGLTAVTGAGGWYRIEHVPSGEVGVTRQGVGPGADYERKKVTLQAGETKRVDFALGSTLLQGEVTRAGEPVHDAWISLSTPVGKPKDTLPDDFFSQSSTSDEEGHYRLVGVRPGVAQLVVNYGKQSLTVPVVISEERSSRLDLDLPARRLEGVVRDSTGKPLASACVASSVSTETVRAGDVEVASDEAQGEGYSRTSTDSEGRFVLYVEEPEPDTATVCTCAYGCQDIGFEPAADEPVTLWFSQK